MNEGQIIGEKYRLVQRISSGGMGSVWQAEHLELGMPAAVKLIDPALAETEEGLLRFRREAQAAASLRSTNIVQIFDYGVSQGVPYIAMELLRGESLARRLAERGKLPAAETALILTQVGKAVGWAHNRGVVHRDLKPDNIFLAEDASETVVKLLDFGIAKQFEIKLEETPTTMTGAMIGTPFYMSPEQAGGKKNVDYRLDIWAFAVIAFECITGKRPFSADTLGGLVLAICSEPIPKPSSLADVPPGFDEWFARAANRNLEKRYSSIREAADDLRRICALPVEEPPLTLSSGGNDHRVLTSSDTVVSSSTPSEVADLTLSHGPTTLNHGSSHGRGLGRRRTQITLGLLVLTSGVISIIAISSQRDTTSTAATLTYVASSAVASPIATPSVILANEDESLRQVVPTASPVASTLAGNARGTAPTVLWTGPARGAQKPDAGAKPAASGAPNASVTRSAPLPSVATPNAKNGKAGADLDDVVGF